MDQQTLNLLTYTGKAQEFPILSTRFVAMMQTKWLQITIWARETTQWACSTNQWDNRWWEELQGAGRCIWERNCRHHEGTKCVVSSATDSKCNNPHADERYLTVCEMTASEMEQRLGRFCQRDFSVETPSCDLVSQLARLQLEDSEDLDSFFIRAQELLTRLQEAGEQSQRRSSTPWSSMVCQWGVKVLLYRKTSIGQRTPELRKRLLNFHESTAQRHKEQSSSVVTGSEAWLQEGTYVSKLFSLWDPCILCRGMQEGGDSTMQQMWWERSPRQGMRETKRWRRTRVSGNVSHIRYTKREKLGCSYKVEDSRHSGGQWLYRWQWQTSTRS